MYSLQTKKSLTHLRTNKNINFLCVFRIIPKRYAILTSAIFFSIFLSSIAFAQGPNIVYTPLENTCVEGARTISATITDPDGVPTSGVGLPVLYWKLNLNTYTAVTGVYNTVTAKYDFNFAAGAFAGSVIYYYIVAQDNTGLPTNVSCNPSTGASGFTVNPPSVTTSPTYPNYFQVQPTLSGSYLVGVGQTFATLTDAFNAYSSSCLSGPVTFLLTDATYGTGESFPIFIYNPRASATNTLTIKPNTSITTTITGSAPDALFKFNGADYVTFDGSNAGNTTRSLTIQNTNTGSLSSVFWLASFNATDGCNNNAIKNCKINGNTPTTTFAGIAMSSGVIISGTSDAPNNNNSFTNNDINNSYYAMYVNGAIVGETGNIINGNTLGSSQAVRKSGYRSLFLSNQINFTVSKNAIPGVASTFYSGSEADATAGIVIAGASTGGVISGNNISDIRNTSILGAAVYGISLQTISNNSGIKIFNNFIHTITGNGKTTNVYENGMGIAVISGGGYNIYYNSILLGTNQTTPGISACLYIGPSTSGTCDIRNNIFSNRQTTGTSYSVYNSLTRSAFNTINFNDYFSTGYVGYLLDPVSNLAGWQAATLSDGNSVVVDPIFQISTGAVALINLHLQPSSTLNDQGTPITGISTDYDDSTRSVTTTDIGADEFTPPNCVSNFGGTVTAISSSIVCISGQAVLACSGFDYGAGMSYQWESSIDNFVTAGVPVPGETNPTTANPPPISASTYFRLRVKCGAGGFGYSNSILITVKKPQITSTTPASRCGTGSLTLSATCNASTTVQWYAEATGGVPLATGLTYTTPVLSATKTYYAEPAYIGSSGSCGPVSPSAVPGTISNQLSPWEVNFDVMQATTLVSVDVFPNNSGDAFGIYLYNSSNTLIGSTSFVTNVSGGATAQVVPLNIFLLPGTDYYLDIRTSDPANPMGTGLTRNISGASYPYISSDIVIIGNGNPPASTWPTYFMCLYNWKFNNGCTVSRVPVNATIGTPSDFTLNGTTNVCSGTSTTLTASSTNTAYTYSWSPLATTGASVTVSPTADIRYTVTANDGSCTNVKTIDVTVSEAPDSVAITNNAPTPLCNGGNAVTLSATGGQIRSLITILNEKFEGNGLPLGWDTLNQYPASATTISAKWTQRTSPFIHTGLSFKSNDSSKFYMTYSDGIPSILSCIRTPRLDFTGYDSAWLSFWMHYSFFSQNDSINVEYFRSGTQINSTNGTSTGGVGWTTLYKAGPSTAPMPSGPTAIGSSIGTSGGFVLKQIDLTPILNRLATRDTFYIRFRYQGTQDFWWAIDNVKIVGKGGSPITWTPITGLYDNIACTNPYNPAIYTTTVYTKPISSVTYTAITGTPNGCSKSASVTLNPRAAVTSVMSGSTTVCPGSTASISIAFTGIAPWKFVVRNITSASNSATLTANSSPYIYTTSAINATSVFKVLSIKDSNNLGCTANTTLLTTDSVKITVGAISARLSGTNSICSGSSTNLTFNFTGSPPWKLGYNAGGSPVVFSNITSNPYIVTVSPTINTTYTIDSLKDNSGCKAIPDSLIGNAIVTVNPFSTAAISGTQTICNGTSANLSVALTGTPPWNLTYTNGTTPTTITGIAASPYTLTVSPTSNTTYSLTALANGQGCNSIASGLTGTSSVTVTPVSVGGTVAGGALVCTGTNSTTLILSGHTGNVVRWESSLDSFATAGTPIVNTTTSLTVANVSTPTFYRAVVANGSCTSANSNITSVKISPNSVGGNVAGGTIVCSGTNSRTLTLSGHTGNVVRWESSLDNFSTAGAVISNTTTTLTVSNLTAATYYRAVVASGSCSNANSSTASIVIAPPVTGALSGTASICENGSTNLSVALSGIKPWSFTYNANGANPVTINNIITTPYSFAVSPLATTTYTLVSVTDSLGCLAAVTGMTSNAVVSITTSSTSTWTGVSSNWFDGNNWCGGIPTNTKDVLIPSGISNMPVITGGNAAVRNITINSGATLTIQNDGFINVAGNTTNNGNLTNNGTFTLNGTIDQSFPGGTTGVVAKMNVLEINKNSGVFTFDKKFAITDTGVLRIKKATTININDTITLKSGSIGTSRIDSIVSTALLVYNGTGCFTVERYIPTGVTHGKSWQLLSAPTFGQTINQAWQEGAASVSSNPKPGYGTTITSNLTGATTSLGFDFFTPAGGTMKVYDYVTNSYIGVPNTSTVISNPKGYMFFVRGDRSVLTSASAAVPVTLRTTGKIYYGAGTDSALSLTVPAGKFQSAGNPYASPIDFQQVLTSSTGLNPTFYVWDPTLQSGNGLGAFQTISSLNLWKPIPGGTINYDSAIAYSKIQSGQGFFVYSGFGGQLKFSEKNKVNGQRSVLRANNASLKMLKLHLRDAQSRVLDGNIVAFDENSQHGVDENDALKLLNFGENTGVLNQGRLLAIDARNGVNADDTIQYNITNLRQQHYTLAFVPTSLENADLTAILIDKYADVERPVSFTDTTVYHFDVDNQLASRQADRFYIVFKTLRPLPVSFTGIRAKREDKKIKVEWDVSGEIAINKYEIEKSADGIHFSKISTQTPIGNDGRNYNYYYYDASPFNGFNFYRIHSVGNSGDEKFTSIVKVWYENQKPQFIVSPNPVFDNIIHVTFINQPSGVYTLNFYNAAGQLMITKTLTHSVSTNFNYEIKSLQILAAGNYTLKINTTKKLLQSIKILVK